MTDRFCSVVWKFLLLCPFYQVGEQARREFRLTCPYVFVLTRDSAFGIMTPPEAEQSGVRIPTRARRPDLLVATVFPRDKAAGA
jgi:hypothetical protein